MIWAPRLAFDSTTGVTKSFFGSRGRFLLFICPVINLKDMECFIDLADSCELDNRSLNSLLL